MKKADIKRILNMESAAAQKILTSEGSKSSKMKALFDAGAGIKDIAAAMQVRYNFVYNVISNYVNMNGIAVEKNKKEGKKDQILEMYLAGKTNKEISIELKTNYNYVFNVIKAYKRAQEIAEANNTVTDTVTAAKPEVQAQ
jgi:transposase-like protein